MNYFTAVTLVGWETRNWHHHEKAISCCKDYGLKPITKDLYIGNLYNRELKTLCTRFAKIFTNKTEKVFTATLCQSCYSLLDSRIKEKGLENADFEVVKLPERSTQSRRSQ